MPRRIVPPTPPVLPPPIGRPRLPQPPALEPLTVTPKTASRLSGLGNTTIFAMCKDGRLESMLVNNRRLILYASLKRLLGLDNAA